MCLHPILIDNPYLGQGLIGTNFLHDTISSKIPVPCGHCVQCVAMRQGFFLQRVQMESLRSHLFMFTLTYNDDSLVYTGIPEYDIPVPWLVDVQNMFHRIRHSSFNDKYDLRYTYVSEYGKKRFRPHFHGILAIDKSCGLHHSIIEHDLSTIISREWRRNYGSRRSPVYEPLYTPKFDRGRCTTFDLHFIEPVRDHDNDVSYYVSKYITKYDSRTYKLLQKIDLDASLSDFETSYLISLIKPRCISSKDFGSWKFPAIHDYITSCANRETSFTFPQYYDLYTGRQMPMSPYYGKRLSRYKALYNRFLLSFTSDELSTNLPDYSTSLDKRISIEHSALDSSNFEKNKGIIFDNQFF